MNMYKHFIKPVIYLAICAGAILVVFITIHIGNGSSVASELEETQVQSVLVIPGGHSEQGEVSPSDESVQPLDASDKTSRTSAQASFDKLQATQAVQTIPTQHSTAYHDTLIEESTQPTINNNLEDDQNPTDSSSQTKDSDATQAVQPTTEVRTGILAPKANDSKYDMPDEMIVNGMVHTPNYIPPEVDIDNLDPSSLYVTDMVRRYIDGTISEREKDALVKISDRNAKSGGLRVYHPTLGNIDIGEQIRADRNPSYIKKETRDENQIKNDYYIKKLTDKTLTPQEREDFLTLCEQEGWFVNGLHGYFLDDQARMLLDATKDYLDIKVYNDHGVEYIAVEDFDIMLNAYNEANAKRWIDNEVESTTSQSATIKWEWTEEEKVIENENSPYLYYLIALYHGGMLTEEEEKQLNEALELYGLVIVPMTTEG